jgi:hypothetical protein
VSHAFRPSAGVLLHQIRHYVRRPSRLLIAALLLPSRFPRLLTLLLSILPVDWPRGERDKAFRLAVGNLVLLRHDRPEQAWHWMQRVLHAGSRSTEEYFLGAVCLYQGLGRMQEATALFARANERDFAQAQAHGVARLPYRVLDEIWARHIGDVATLDYVIKLDTLEGRRAQDIVLYVPPGGRIGNRFLLDQVATRLRLVERADDLPFAAAAVGALHYHYQFPRQPDGSTVFFWELASRTHQRWHEGGQGPLFELPAEVTARGWEQLEEAGVPRGAWFVALHVRYPLARDDRRAAGDPQCRHRELSACDRRNNPSRWFCHPHGRCGHAAFAAACERDRLWSERHALRLDGYFPSDAQPFRSGISVRADLRSAALWRALRADELVAAWHAALACVGYLYPEASQARGRRSLFDTKRNAPGAGGLLPFVTPSRR